MMPPGVAFATIGKKSGRGRNTRQKPAVLEVEAAECSPGRLHELTNDARGRTHCRHCGRPWAALDAEIREAS